MFHRFYKKIPHSCAVSTLEFVPSGLWVCCVELFSILLGYLPSVVLSFAGVCCSLLITNEVKVFSRFRVFPHLPFFGLILSP